MKAAGITYKLRQQPVANATVVFASTAVNSFSRHGSICGGVWRARHTAGNFGRTRGWAGTNTTLVRGDDAVGSRLFGEAAAVIRLSAASWSWPSHIMKLGPVTIERIT